MSASVVGALLGLGVQLYANAVQKLPLMHAPWKHAVSATVGAGVASWIVELEEQGKKDIEGMIIHMNHYHGCFIMVVLV